jgi:hypothetical protein
VSYHASARYFRAAFFDSFLPLRMDHERPGYLHPVSDPDDPLRDTERYQAKRDALRDVVSSNVPPSRRERRTRRGSQSWWRRAVSALKPGARE